MAGMDAAGAAGAKTPVEAVEAVAALEDPTRRRLYELIASRAPAPVGRDEAARELGLPRSVAAFHLDRLVTAGLLETVYRRLSGRVGPGAGRPAKLYRRADASLEITLPHRDYQLAAELMARSISAEPGSPAFESLMQQARSFGRQLAEEARRNRSGRGRRADLDAALKAMEAKGYEPVRAAPALIELRNCPFHALQQDHAEIVCSMNLNLLEGLARTLDLSGLQPRLEVAPGRCCVTFTLTRAVSSRGGAGIKTRAPRSKAKED